MNSLPLSPFQLFPSLVVELVVDYVASSSGRSVKESKNDDTHRLPLIPLLWVCRNFRDIVYSRFCTVYELDLSSSPVKAGWSSWPTRLRKMARPAYRLASVVVLRLDQWSMFSGEARELLSNNQYSRGSIPNARLLTLEFVSGRTHTASYLGDTEIIANIIRFAEHLWQMAPAITEVKLPGRDFSGRVRKIDTRHFINLALKLYQYEHVATPLRNPFNFIEAGISDLVTLDCNLDSSLSRRYSVDNDSYAYFLQLTRQNASTLRSLIVNVGSVKNVSSLVRDAGGNYAEYPSLHTLKLCGPRIECDIYNMSRDRPLLPPVDIAKLPVFPDATPFPRLLQLHISISYPFGDDTLFRGNAARLKYLDIQIYPATVDILRKYALFTPASHPHLQLVYIDHMANFQVSPFASPKERMQFLLSIGPHAPVRKIYDIYSKPQFKKIVSLFADHTCIQTLSLPGTCMEFKHIIILVKSLPLLKELCTNAPCFDSIPTCVALPTAPAVVVAMYAPVGARLRRWHFGGKGKYDEIAKCVLLLALVCPNLDDIDASIFSDGEFVRKLQNVYYTQGFESHATRLKKLAFKF
ncbi:hypothetical protein GGI19_001443 [Coemansia pectinata]|uniref:Uncharacterized protein n=1 Tax=Coemansia pectinata TaxID=1052879 RepID=A0A9W8GYY9_9FUNG|nr:hypothetical protein GGI19_001443 [Coemansia pectinata]